MQLRAYEQMGCQLDTSHPAYMEFKLAELVLQREGEGISLAALPLPSEGAGPSTSQVCGTARGHTLSREGEAICLFDLSASVWQKAHHWRYQPKLSSVVWARCRKCCLADVTVSAEDKEGST